MSEVMPTVFVVDDDASVRGALARRIRSVGLQVETFASGQEFLDGARPDAPACLVLDLRLPIIFLTGHGTVQLCARALKAGAVDFLQKPCGSPL